MLGRFCALALTGMVCAQLVFAAEPAVPPSAPASASAPPSALSPPPPQVMGWVPPYALEAAAFGIHANSKIGQTLTRIGLQFWNPSSDGTGLVLAPTDKNGPLVSEASVMRFRDWARARNIKVLLTVYNNSQNSEKWDWDLAKRAFATNRALFTQALIAEMDKYQLDGIDLDLEGEGDFEADRAPYAVFVKELSALLKARGKLLTIDTYHSPCHNAPNMSWWQDWAGQVDELHSMGYQDLYESSEETFTPPNKPVCEGGVSLFKYSWQLQYGLRAGYRADQILFGQPTWIDKWGKTGRETDPVSHIREVQALGAGIGLWDLQIPTPGWRTDATWDAARDLRLRPGSGWKRYK